MIQAAKIIAWGLVAIILIGAVVGIVLGFAVLLYAACKNSNIVLFYRDNISNNLSVVPFFGLSVNAPFYGCRETSCKSGDLQINMLQPQYVQRSGVVYLGGSRRPARGVWGKSLSFRGFLKSLLAVLIVYFALKLPFLILVKLLNWPLWSHHIGSALCSCLVLFIGGQLKGSDTSDITLVRLVRIFLISLFALNLFSYLIVLLPLIFPVEVLSFLVLIFLHVYEVLGMAWPISTAYADSPEPEPSNNEDRNTRSRSRSPSSHPRSSGIYRERSPRMPPMSIRVSRANIPTPREFARSLPLPVLTRPQDMNGVDIIDILPGSIIYTVARQDAAWVTRYAIDGGPYVGFLPVENLFDSPRTPHEYNDSSAWYARCSNHRVDFFSARQLAYKMFLRDNILAIMTGVYHLEADAKTMGAAERLASYQFKHKYEANNYFLS